MEKLKTNTSTTLFQIHWRKNIGDTKWSQVDHKMLYLCKDEMVCYVLKAYYKLWFHVNRKLGKTVRWLAFKSLKIVFYLLYLQIWQPRDTG